MCECVCVWSAPGVCVRTSVLARGCVRVRVSVFGAPGSRGLGRRRPGPALRCRWAGPAARPAALAALGSRPRRARRAGLGLRGGAGTGSGKQQCSGGGGGGGGALPLQEPSAGRRAGAAASRDCGPRRPHGRRGGESRRRPAAAERQARGADLPREDAPTRTWDPASPCVLLPQPHPGLRLRFTALPLPLAGSPLPSDRSASRASRDPSPLPSARGAPLPLRSPRTPLSRSGHSLPTPRTLPSPQTVLWGARPGRQGVAEHSYRHPGGGTRRSRRGLGRPALPGSRARSVVPTSLRSSTWEPLAPGGPPDPGPEISTELACVSTSLPEWNRPRRPGGGGGASPVALQRAQQAGRSLLSKTPGWSRRCPASLCPRRPGWRRSYRTGAAFATGRTSFPPTGFELPRANASREV